MGTTMNRTKAFVWIKKFHDRTKNVEEKIADNGEI
jgi:hypothetical protein